MFNLFFKATGHINQKAFIIGVVGLFIFVEVMKYVFRVMPVSIWEFWLVIVYVPMVLYIICCVYGKRLHDIGRSWWPLTGAFTLEFLAAIGVMMAYGGVEYFEAFSQYDRKAVIDPETRDAIIGQYQATQAANIIPISIILLIVPVCFTLWLAITKPKIGGNPYRK